MYFVNITNNNLLKHFLIYIYTSICIKHASKILEFSPTNNTSITHNIDNSNTSLNH